MEFTIYYPETGEVYGHGQAPADEEENQIPDGFGHILGVSGFPRSHYVDVSSQPHVLKKKIVNPSVIDKTSGSVGELFTISSIPATTTIDPGLGTSYEVADGLFEFDFDHAGTYEIICESIPYLDKIFTVVIE